MKLTHNRKPKSGKIIRLVENTGINVSYKYGYLGKTILLTLFYLSIFPVGVLISFVGLVIFYFIEKVFF